MVCEVSFAGDSYVNLLGYILLSVSETLSHIVLFSKKILLSLSNTSLIFFGRSPLLLCRSSCPPEGKRLFKDADVLLDVKLLYFCKVHFQYHRCF